MKRKKLLNTPHKNPLTTLFILREKAMLIFKELNPLLTRHFKSKGKRRYKKYPKLNKAEHKRMLDLIIDYSDVNALIEEHHKKKKVETTP